jgi:predicted transglutaminase-like protease
MKWIAYKLKNGERQYIGTFIIPPYEVKLTSNRKKAQVFLDREWLEEKLRYYDVDNIFIEEL